MRFLSARYLVNESKLYMLLLLLLLGTFFFFLHFKNCNVTCLVKCVKYAKDTDLKYKNIYLYTPM